MAQIQGIIGLIFIIFLAFLLSNNKRRINYRVVAWGLGLQLFFAIIIIVTPIGKPFFAWFDSAIRTLLDFSKEGSEFLFASFGTGNIEGPLMNFAFIALPTVIFFSALMAMFYHYGIMQKIIAVISKIMQKTMGTSGAETTSISANIFVGQTEAPLVVKPFISKMTKSELMAIMVGGFATVAGGVMALYVSVLGDIEGIAGHLLAASIMSAPAALVIAKIIYPETENTMSSGDIKMSIQKKDDNGLEALARGSSEGLKLAANIAAMLVAFVAFIALLNYLLKFIIINDTPLSIELLLGYLFMPLAWMMGAPWAESQSLGSLMGQKLVLTELVAYFNLADMQISPRTTIIASYALCGFANFASIGIQLGGIGSIAPERRKDLSKLVFKAMLGGALASWLTASVAGIMIPLQKTGDIDYDGYVSYRDINIIKEHIVYEKLKDYLNNLPEGETDPKIELRLDEAESDSDTRRMSVYEDGSTILTKIEKLTGFDVLPDKMEDWQIYYADFNQDGCITIDDITEIEASNGFRGDRAIQPIQLGLYAVEEFTLKNAEPIHQGINAIIESLNEESDESIDECRPNAAYPSYQNLSDDVIPEPKKASH